MMGMRNLPKNVHVKSREYAETTISHFVLIGLGIKTLH